MGWTWKFGIIRFLAVDGVIFSIELLHDRQLTDPLSWLGGILFAGFMLLFGETYKRDYP